MIYLRRIIMISAAVIGITMQGCSCDDDNDKKYNPPPQTNNVSVQGTTAKGLLKGFTVSAYTVAANGAIGNQPVATATTGSNGTYTLAIPADPAQQPLLIRVTPAASGSTMTCDMTVGCGSVAFGEDIPVAADSGFTLSALVPGAATTGSTVNITIFTDIAAALTLDDFSGTDVDALRDAIATANSMVANRFGIVGDLTQIPVIDLTNNAAVTAALNNGNAIYVRYAAINAAIIAAVLSDNPNTSIAAALRAFVDDYVAQGLAGNVSAEADTSWAEILEYAQAALNIVRANVGAQGSGLAALIQALVAETQLANLEVANSYDRGTASETAGMTPLEKSKAMVVGLRDLLFSFGETQVGNGTLGSIADDFALQVEAAELAASEDAVVLMEAMATAASAVDDAYRARMSNNSLTSYTGENNVIVTITSENNVPVFTVNQDVGVTRDASVTQVTVNLVSRNGLTLTEPQQNSPSATANGVYNVTGSAQSPTLRMTIGDGSRISITDMAVVEAPSQQNAGVTESHTLEAFELRLLMGINQRNVDNAVSMSGNLVVDLADTSLVENTTVGQATTTEITTFNIGVIGLKFYGDVRNAAGHTASFSLSVAGDGTGVSLVETWINGNSSLAGETANDWADLSGSLLFTARITGNPNLVVMNYGLTRTGLSDADNTLSIKYPGQQFRFSLAVADGEPAGYLTIVNQDGVALRIREVVTNGDRVPEGDVSYGGTVYGTIQQSNSQVVVRFPVDGGFDTVTLY